MLKDGTQVWTYEYSKMGKSFAWGFVPGGNFKKPGQKDHQVLELRLKDDVVINHAFTDMNEEKKKK